jgi:hypothetical protein
MTNNIKAYLAVFAKNLGHNLSENDRDLNFIAEQIEARTMFCNKNQIFEQNLHSTCKNV